MFSVVPTNWNNSTIHRSRRTTRKKWTVTWFWSCAVACLTVVVVRSRRILNSLLLGPRQRTHITHGFHILMGCILPMLHCFFVAPLPGYISDRFGCRITNSVGAMLCMTGLVTSSFAQSLTLMFLTHGLLMGLGISFIYSSCFLVIAKYFKEKLSVVTGIVSLGAGFGVLFTGPLLQALLDSYGWRGT